MQCTFNLLQNPYILKLGLFGMIVRVGVGVKVGVGVGVKVGVNVGVGVGLGQIPATYNTTSMPTKKH
jgi:hypothetical protein